MTDTTDSPGTTDRKPAATTQVYQLYINADPGRLWAAITDPATLQRFFFGALFESTWQPGAALRSWSPDHAQQWGDNIILEADPPRRLVHTWRSLYDQEMATEPESRVTWEIEAVPCGISKLTVVHDRLGGSPKTAASVRGWSYVLSSLKSLLETGEPLPAMD
jgi:uncharacterized protein YndB with AHSA1/START domain